MPLLRPSSRSLLIRRLAAPARSAPRAPRRRLGLALALAALAAAALAPLGAHARPLDLSLGETGPALETAEGEPARAFPDLRWNLAPAPAAAAWHGFTAKTVGPWQALWDADTGVPSRIYGPGVEVPGSVASAEVAAAYARGFLARNIDLLAPGSAPEDFEIVSNDLSDGMRTVGMFQRKGGLRVLGGQVSFRFKNDRLFVVASEALPYVEVAPVIASMSAAVAAEEATRWVQDDADQAWATAVDGPYILPIVSRRAVRYQTVMRATVEARAPVGRFHVYVDSATGAAVAREQLLHFAEGTVRYNVPARYPGADREDLPASFTTIELDGEPLETDADGLVSWAGDGAASVVTKVVGSLVTVVNEADPDAETTATHTLSPAGTVVWDGREDEQLDAQIATYAHALVVKDYVRRFAPELAYLDTQLVARVNIDSACNAFSDGTTINFFRSSPDCENTGRLADVVYHEFGHSLHWQSLIPGVGRFDGAFSEGLSDYLAATITGDPGMGRGFFYTEEPLRQIDPEDFEHRWPRDIQRIHYTGLIFAGAMWDLRQGLVALYGEDEGVAVADRLFYAAVRRASSIPATYVEILAADDDDGDLSNGTPHECLINATFGALHGLREISVGHTPVGAQAEAAESYPLSFEVRGLTDRCDGDRLVSAAVVWEVPGTDEGDVIEATGALGDDGAALYRADIPAQAAGARVRYHIELETADGGTWSFPDNLGATEHEFYVGDLMPLYCTDFESDPFAEGWRHGLADGEASVGADDWEWGAPGGKFGDPDAAYSGTGVIGNDLGSDGYDGGYQPSKINYIESPLIEVGNYSDVRVQFRRWLTVEDARWDYATVYANDAIVWRNRATRGGDQHHLDSTWTFQDVPIGAAARGGSVRVRFEIQSDGGLEFGGWNIDDFCVLVRPDAVCGNGEVEAAEQCDDGDGNSDEAPNACRSSCRRNFCGDGVVDRYEQCDDGNTVPGDGCTADCYLPHGDGGCSAGDEAGPTAAALLLLLLLLGLARRKSQPLRSNGRDQD
ncbi:DUF4215 domain-containing protein [Haliangium sp.]|uniref:DUF4215 domain-containing protein n=1 Tax=Haliangium sp. TaxID=2663208 RepID=UPI003D0C6836